MEHRNGFGLEKTGHAAAASGAPFLGTRSLTVELMAGTWCMASRPSGAPSPAITVS